MLLGKSLDLLVCNYRHFSLIGVLINYLKMFSKNLTPSVVPNVMHRYFYDKFYDFSCTLLILCIFMITLHIKMVAVRQYTHYMKRTPTFKHLTHTDLQERWLKSPSGINSGNSSQEDLLLNPWRSREYCRVSSSYKFCWDDSDYS